MPVLNPEQTAQALRRLLRGEHTLFGWGAVQHIACYDWRTPLPFVAIVDSSTTKWGSLIAGLQIVAPATLAEQDTATTLVMILPYSEPFFDDIVRAIERIGPFQIVPYMETEELAQRLEAAADTGEDDGHAARPEDVAARRLRHLRRIVAAAARTDPTDRLIELLRKHCPQPAALGAGRRADLALTRLSVGGAQRQMVALGDGLVAGGWSVRLLVTTPEPKEAAHYAADAIAAGIGYECRAFPGNLPVGDYMDTIVRDLSPPFLEIFSLIPAYLIVPTYHFLKAFQANRPDVVIAYLDPANVAASLAALLAGVPRIVISGRNYNPSHFPMFFGHVHERLQRVYQAIVRMPNLVLTGNSPTAAKSYAEWAGLPENAVPMIPNALGTASLREPDAAAATAELDRCGIGTEEPLILGVFRLAPEKDPLGFVAVIDRLHALGLDFKALICGTGPLLTAVQDEIARCGLTDVLYLAGAIGEVPALYRRATLLLHTAELEGMPNVIMEAQAFGLPIVCTRAGGTEDCLSSELKPFMHETGDYDGLARSCAALMDAPDRRRGLSATIEPEARRRFSVDRLVEDTLRAAGIPVDATWNR